MAQATMQQIVTEEKPQSLSPSLDPNFAIYRHLVPLVASPGITYLNASFAPPSNLIVHEAITRFSSEALHDPAPKPHWQETAAKVRALVARYIKADDPSSIAFTRDTTSALGCFIHSLKFTPGDNVVVLDTEHPNHVYGWMALRVAGLEIRQVPTIAEAERIGEVVAATAEDFAPFVDERTRAIGLSSIMFHSRQWNDVAGICAAYRPRGIHVLADLTQQVGFAEVDVQALGVSAAALSLHKGLNCPTGFAVLYVDPAFIRNTDPAPPIVGYGAVNNTRADLLVPSDPVVSHPSTRRYEHLNLNLVAAAAAKAFLQFYLDVMGPGNVQRHLYALGDELRLQCKSLGVGIVGPESRQQHAPHLYVLDLHDVRWMARLKESGVYVTPYRLGIRVSFGFYNNLSDVTSLVDVLRSGPKAGIPAK